MHETDIECQNTLSSNSMASLASCSRELVWLSQGCYSSINKYQMILRTDIGLVLKIEKVCLVMV